MTTATTTVIIPVFNGERYIGAALASVRAQTRPVDEVIVVDDGSTDGTLDVLRNFPEVVVLQQANAGPAAARNRGIEAAHGDYLAMLDADDMWPPNRNEVMAERLDEDPTLGLVLGYQRLLIEPGAEIPAWVPAGDPETIDPETLPKPTGVFLTRRSTFATVGPFDEAMRHGEDTDWFLRSQDCGVRWGQIQDVVLVRRLHGRNLTNATAAQRHALFDVLQRRMARRRSD